MKREPQNSTGPVNHQNQNQTCKVEFHSRHHKLVVRDLKTGRYTKKPNKH